MGRAKVITIDSQYVEQRIDNFLMRELKHLSKSRIYKILRKGEVRVNKKRVDAKYRLQESDQVRLPPYWQAEENSEKNINKALLNKLSNNILYEDSDLIIINKPAGLAVHGGSGISYSLIDVVQQLKPDLTSLAPAHRLDRATSGCIVLTKHRQAAKQFQQLLLDNHISKHYLLLASGAWCDDKSISIESNLAKHRFSGEHKVEEDDDGKYAHTDFKVKQCFAEATLLQAVLHSGRTHQIRVHIADYGYPIVGDDKYGNKDVNKQWAQQGAKRLFLHAHSLQFKWHAKMIHVEAPLDEKFAAILKQLS